MRMSDLWKTWPSGEGPVELWGRNSSGHLSMTVRGPLARVTVWYPSGPLTGSWYQPALALWCQQLYEYLRGVPATVERRRYD